MNHAESRSSARGITLSTLMVLLFIQLLTIWMESIYRIALIKTSMGGEIIGLSFVFLPLLLLLVPLRVERHLLIAGAATMLIARIICNFIGAADAILVAGLGVGASLIVLSYALSGAYRNTASALGPGIGLGLLLSILLRACGSSYDITFGGPGVIVGGMLVIVFILLTLGKLNTIRQDDAAETGSLIDAFLSSIGWFANTAILYIVLSSPAVISAWGSTSYFLNVLCIGTAWAVATTTLSTSKSSIATLPRWGLVLWNVAFSGTLVLAIRLQTVSFPTTPESAPVVVEPGTLPQQTVFYLMLLLSPVVLANLCVLLQRPHLHRPRAMAIPVIIGAVTLNGIILLAIFTNVWGYIGPFGAHLRNQFYLPFLIAGIGMLLPYGVRSSVGFPTKPVGAFAPVAAWSLALFALFNVAALGWPKAEPRNEKKLTVLTYNNQLGSEEEGDRNYRNQLDFIRKVNPDIIGMQESDSPRPAGGNVDAARYFAEALGYYMYFGPSTISGTFGTAIISRYPLQTPHTLYSFSDKDETGTAAAEIEVAGTRIALFNSHPAGSPHNFLSHARDLVAAAKPHEYVIATGDYNARPGSDSYTLVTGLLYDPWFALYPDGAGKRHPEIGFKEGDLPTIEMPMPIDHVFLTHNFKVEEAYYVPAPQSETDHPAHWVVITWE